MLLFKSGSNQKGSFDKKTIAKLKALIEGFKVRVILKQNRFLKIINKIKELNMELGFYKHD